MRGAIAAGHPLTAQAGARVLAEGGNAVDACIAAAFASGVTESPLSGPGSGGFMLIHRARDGSTRLADFFVAAPGLGHQRRTEGEMAVIDVSFGAGTTTTQPFRIGPASCAVPGTVAGLAAVHKRYGRLPWPELLAPGIELARDGVELTRAQAHMHALLDPILRFGAEGRRIYGKKGGRLELGDRLRLSDLADTLEAVARNGPAAFYRGERARAIVATVRAGGGAITAEDLAAYRVAWRRPVEVGFHGYRVLSNPPPSSGGVLIAYGLALLQRIGCGTAGSADAMARLAGVMSEQARARGGRFVTDLHRGGLAARLLDESQLHAAAKRIRAEERGLAEQAPAGGTTHISVIDAAGNAASLSNSTGSGSGVIVPGTGIYLNNMLGEYDLVGGRPVVAGRRLTSMMAPTIALDRLGAPKLVVGSAGSARLRGAIMQIVVNVLVHGMTAAEAIAAPRVHVDDLHLHCEGGHDAAALDQLEARGYDVVRWRRHNLFFGGAAAVGVRADGGLEAAGDARRGGAGVVT